MPKEKGLKKVKAFRHQPLKNHIEQPSGKLKAPLIQKKNQKDEEEEKEEEVNDFNNEDSLKIPSKLARMIDENEGNKWQIQSNIENADSDDESFNADEEEKDEFVDLDNDNIVATGLSESEEAVVQRFLQADRNEARTLADIIMDKLKESSGRDDSKSEPDQVSRSLPIPPRVAEVFTSIGKMLHHYKSGKLPKALKMLPHLKNWEEVLWLTRPDEWSPCATFASTRIFASNLNAKMAQRFYNLVLLEKCRDDIRENKTLNYHLYMALKKSLFKPAAFYKGILLPLAQSGTCTLREATIFASILMKASIPGNHSAAVLLRLAELPYTGSTSLFIRVLLLKKYALPRRVIDALVHHFASFETDSRQLPVIWHQSLLAFAQRYKLELDDIQRQLLKSLMKVHSHHQITPEVRREIFSTQGLTGQNLDDEDRNTVISYQTNHSNSISMAV